MNKTKSCVSLKRKKKPLANQIFKWENIQNKKHAFINKNEISDSGRILYTILF